MASLLFTPARSEFRQPRGPQNGRGVLDFWLEMDVDGIRLDAIPYLYEREGTNCENLPETDAYLKKLRAHMEAKFPDRMLLVEVVPGDLRDSAKRRARVGARHLSRANSAP